jgi:regulator of protease activity HflC (stomatin/prohibitin superfamily)
MSSIRQKQAAMHKKQLKEEEERRINGNKPIINANANLDIDKIAKEADKQADEILAKVVKESKPKAKKVSKLKAVVKTKAKVVKKKK